MADLQAWERQDGESSQAFAAFVIYRDAGRDRSILKAYQQHKPTATLIAGQWSDWSREWRWLERAQAYDDYLDAERRKVRERRLLELEERRIDFEIRKQAENEKWVEDLDGELRAALTDGYTEVEEQLIKDPESGQLHPIKKKTKVKFPSLSAVARLLHERNETFRVAVEGPRTKDNPTAKTSEAETPAGGGGAFEWIKPDPEAEDK